MPVWLDMSADGFEAGFEALLTSKREASTDIDAIVAAIIEDVRKRGDEALADYSLRFDRVDLASARRRGDRSRKSTRLSTPAIEAALAALELAHDRVLAYHQRQKPADVSFVDALGVELGWRWRAIDAVGLYVPGGAASYPSSVVMNAVPAKVAGCARIVMAVPDAGGPHQSARAGGGQARRRVGNLSRRRRAGDRRFRLWHADASGRSPKSSAPAMPMSPPPSAASSASSASI